MKIKEQYDDVKLPTWSLSYIINGESSGITEDDKKMVDEYMAQFTGGDVIVDVSDEEEYFTWSPEFGLACNVVDATILVLVPD